MNDVYSIYRGKNAMRNRGQQDRESTEELKKEAYTKRSSADTANKDADEADHKYQARINEKDREIQKNQAYDKQLQDQENQTKLKEKVVNIIQGAVIGVLVLAFFYLVNEQLFGRSPESTPK